ncbi:MAG: hypothetical protein JWQ49_5947 [Edaphobacter sp.]|nr:hypothetical protein [Edaphobacter sp.]
MKTANLLTTLSLFLLSGFTHAQNSAPTKEDLAKYVQHMMDIQVAFEQPPTAGISIEAREISRTGKSGDDLVVQYHIFVKGVPENTLFKEIVWPVTAEKPDSPLGGISVGKDGILMCAGTQPYQCGSSEKPNDPIEFIIQPRRGEPSRIAFIAPNIELKTMLVPDPIESKDKSCTLHAVRLTSKFELAYISGSGYTPNSDVHYRAVSETTNDLIIRSDDKGTIRFSLIPHTGQKQSGTVQVKITDFGCSPGLSYEWGKI